MTALEPLHAGPVDLAAKQLIRTQLLAMADRATALAEAKEIDDLARGFAVIDAIRRDLNTIHRDIGEALARLIFDGVTQEGEVVEPRKKYAPPGLPVIEARGGNKSSNWQSEELFPLVVKAAKERATAPEVDPVSGEVLRPAVELSPEVEALIDRVLEVVTGPLPANTGSVGWRKRALKGLGIDPEEFCETKPGVPSVQFHGGDK